MSSGDITYITYISRRNIGSVDMRECEQGWIGAKQSPT